MAEHNTIPGLLKANYEKWGDNEVAIRDKDFGLWQEYTWKDSYEKMKYFCLGLTMNPSGIGRLLQHRQAEEW